MLPYVVAGTAIDATAVLREILGLPATATRVAVNSSYTPGALEFKRLVNHLAPDLLALIDADLDRWLQAYSDARPDWRPALEDLVDADICTALEDHFRPAVVRVEQAFGMRLGRRSRSPQGPADSPADVCASLAADRDLAARLARAVAAAVAATPAASLPAAVAQLGVLAQAMTRS